MSDHAALDAAHGHARAFLDTVRDRPAGPSATVAEVAAALGGPLPTTGSDPVAVIDRLARAAEPGLANSPGPRYFGWVVGGSVEAATAADTLAVAWDQVAGMQIMSPAAAAAEEVAGAWLVELLGLPEGVSFGFATGAQMANFTGLAAARHAVLKRAGWDVERDGLQGAPRVRVFAGEQSHATVYQALRYLGLGAPRQIPVDIEGRIRPEALAEALADGEGPAIVCAQAGDVNSGAFDPFGEIADACATYGAWLHVDGAFGLWAAASPSLRHLVEGIDRADSWATDCHKWLNVPYDSAVVFVRDPEAHAAAMTWQTSYVTPGEGREPYRYVPEASRRARGFAVWAAIAEMGAEGIADLVDRCCENARRFAGLMAAEPGVEILNDVVLNQVVVRFGDSDQVTHDVAARVQAEGTCWLGGTTWNGRDALRFSTTNWSTTARDIDLSADAVLAAYRASLHETATSAATPPSG
jgi:glutamate/tyrosine decarboxylase-like PLP-dependent enzyme